MNQRNLKIITIFLFLISPLVSCKKSSSVRPGGPITSTPQGGYWNPATFSQGVACWTWTGSGTPNPTSPAAPTVANSGTWNWYASSRCFYWSGTGTAPTPDNSNLGGGCWTWANGAWTSSSTGWSWSGNGSWTWTVSGGWSWTGTGTRTGSWVWNGTGSASNSPGYNYLPGQNDPNANSDCYAKGVSNGGSGSLPYYRITATGHGNPGNLVWSSSSLPSGDQQILTTDSRFNVRVVAKASPPKGTKDYKGVTCNYEGIAFSNVKLTIGLRKPNSNYYTSTYDISGIPVGKCSDVYEFTDYQIPVTSGPIVLDILNFQTDYWCKTYEGTRYAGNPAYCPYVALYANDCFSIEVQFATDFTLDIPH